MLTVFLWFGLVFVICVTEYTAFEGANAQGRLLSGSGARSTPLP